MNKGEQEEEEEEKQLWIVLCVYHVHKATAVCHLIILTSESMRNSSFKIIFSLYSLNVPLEFEL